MVEKDRTEPGEPSDDANKESDVDQSTDVESKSAWVHRFKKNWLGGEALEYATTNHLPTFIEKNAVDPKEGTAYALACANDLMLVFGEFGPWGADSKAKDTDADEDDRPYDYVSDDEDTSVKEKSSSKKRVLKRKRDADEEHDETVQEREAKEYKRLHIDRLRKASSYVNWLRYRYKYYEGGNTARGRANHQKVSKKKSKSKTTSASTTGEELSTLLVHELLGIGQTKVRIPHAFQLWAKDLPEKAHKTFLKRFRKAGGKMRDRAGAEMHHFAGKFNKLDEDKQQEYYDKRAELKAAAEKKREELGDKVKTRLDPEDAANLIDVMPLLLDPLLTSLGAMLNAKICLLIGVPHPREGGELVIKALDKGDNNDTLPVSLGKTLHFAPMVDAFSQFCDDAYSTAELKAAAIPGTLPKSPQKKKVKNAEGREKVMIVVQNMALPEGENWASRKAAEEDGESDDSGDEIANRRRRRIAREEREKQREEQGEPVKRPRGRPKKKAVVEDDDDSGAEESGPRPKKTMPEPPAKRRKTTKTSTASGVATLGEVSGSRGRKKPEASMTANRKKLLELARVASGNGHVQRNGRKRVLSLSPERSRSPVPSGNRPKKSLPVTPDTPRPSTLSTTGAEEQQPAPPRPRPKPLNASKPMAVIPPNITEQLDDLPQSPPPVQRHRSRSRALTVIPEEDEHHTAPQDIAMDDLDLGIEDAPGLDVDDFEAPIPAYQFESDRLFDEAPTSRSPRRPSNVNVRGEQPAVADKQPAKTQVFVAVPVRVTRGRAEQRIPPSGDHKNKSSASRLKPPSVRTKPPSTRAASQAPPAPPLNPFDRTRWSDWFTNCYDQFDSISTDDWRTMLNIWTQVEALAEFRVGKYVNLEGDLRPTLLADWINTRRTQPMIVPRGDLKQFVEKFWAWYIALQPEWRDVAGLDGPLTADQRPSPNGRHWGVLYNAKGRNGIVSVIACLAWWGRHHTLTKGPLGLGEQWNEAVADVTYVLQGLLDAGWEA